MARTLWFAAGAGAAVYAMNRARRVRDALTADGLRDRAQGRTEKETELRTRLGLVPNGTPELESGGKHRALAPENSTTTEQEGST